jgi:hypothetical protein
MRRALAIAAAALAAAAPALGADTDYANGPPSTPPRICRGSAFVDVVGTRGPDSLRAPSRATRVWGLAGEDRLAGSSTRASCLIGGRGDDRLALSTGGGVAFGNQGRDFITGSDLGDVIDPGSDADGVVAGGGDDKITVRDRKPEVVACGDGDDIVKADRIDVLVGCESVDVVGPSALRLEPRPRDVSRRGSVGIRLQAPRGGDYRVLYVTTAEGRRCGGGPVQVAHPGKLRRGQRKTIQLRAPGRGWCPGSGKAVVLRYAAPDMPPVGVARLTFSVR